MKRLLSALGAAPLGIVVLTAAGCVSVPPAPLPELALAHTAIVQAEHAGAAQAAPEELSSARQRLSEAEQLQTRDPDLARWRAREAESDARVAETVAEDARAHVALSLHRVQIASRSE